jgi:putative hydrolase of the HAD superfamily
MLSEREIRSRLQPLTPISTGVQPKGGELPPIRCILFDVYGTLFISASGDIGIAKTSETTLQQLADLLSRYRIDLPPEEVLQRYYRAIEADHRQSKSKGIEFPEVDAIRIWEEVLEGLSADQIRGFVVEFEILSNPTYPMPNLPETLAACRKRGVRMGLISNAQFYTPLLFRWFLDAEPEDLGFDNRLLFFSYHHGQAKPGEHLYRLAVEQLRQMKIEPSAALYVGNDMLNDIYPAKAVGFLTALFAGDARSLRLREDDPRCRVLRPDLVVTDLNQLIPYLPQSSA